MVLEVGEGAIDVLIVVLWEFPEFTHNELPVFVVLHKVCYI